MCLHEGHEGHRFKSLKGLVFQAEKYLKSVKSLEIDSRQLKQTIAESQTRLLAHLEEFETEISNSLKLVRVSIETVFVKMLGQIDMRTGGCNSLLEVLE